MFRFLVFFGLIAIAMAGAVVYTTHPEYPSASGYEYQHTVQTPEYVSHASVSAPLNGFVGSPHVRTVYTQPLAYHQEW